jgi:cobalamin biosynthesis protein CbiM/cobalt ECF transporter T component CbiQ
MHIMEGFLPLEWCIFWFLLSVPVVIWGMVRVKGLFRDDPDKKLMVAVSGAFIFVISSLKLPSVTGSSSHPTGTGIGTILYGVGVTSVLTTIVLVFQALLLAHGGLTTLGANVFSMGIAGPLAAYALFRGMRALKIGMPISVFAAALIADLMTYVVTAIQLSLAFPTNGHFLPSFEVFLTVYAVTQIPLAIMEGILTVMFFGFLARSRPDLLGLGEDLKPSKMSKRARVALVTITILVIVMAMVMVRVSGLQGSDNAGSDVIVKIDPQYVPWAHSLWQLDESSEIMLFALQTLLGLAIIALVWRSWRRKRKDAVEAKPAKRDGTAIMTNWPPLGKLLLTLSLLLVSLISQNIIVPIVILGLGLALLMGSNRLRMPRAMVLALIDGLAVVAIGSVIIAVVTSGNADWTLWIGSFGLVFSDNGISLALLVFLRAAAGITIMLFFASTTPIPHLAQALRQLRVPREIAELVILVYRYSFLVLEQYEKMMLAANCRLGLRGVRTSLRTLSKVAVGVFIRSIGVAERSQISLQCRNFQGDFPTYREPARMSVAWVALPLLAFISLYTLNMVMMSF